MHQEERKQDGLPFFHGTAPIRLCVVVIVVVVVIIIIIITITWVVRCDERGLKSRVNNNTKLQEVAR